jgi:hypothetical protein
MQVLLKLVLGCVAFYVIVVLIVAFFQNSKSVKNKIDKTYANIFGKTSFFDDFVFKTLGLIIIMTITLKVIE